MRLTLRTLLAYLDDTLEPAQTRMIGQKVAESDAAQELIARIKQVTRRRRLTTPPATGPGARLDPNTIAEYLDNVLPSEQLAEVEETCLASDVHLAEVSACHQILTLVLGEPALVPPTARQRMYGLIQGRESIRNRQASAKAVGQGSLNGPDAAGDDAEEGLLLGPLMRPGSWLRWVIPVVAACVLLAAGTAIWMAMVSSFPKAGPLKPSSPDDNRLAVNTPGPKARSESPPQPPVPDKAAEEKANAATAAKAAPEPKKDQPAETKVEKSKPTEPATEPIAPPVKPAPLPQVQPPRTERREIGRAVLMAVTPSVLLQHASEGGPWQRLKPQSRLFATDYLVSLPGYHSELKTDSGVHLLLWGNLPQFSQFPGWESGVVLYANPDLDLDFKLDRGRVVLSNHKESGPARVRVRFFNEAWDLTLPDKATEVALDLFGFCLPYTKETNGGEPANQVRLYALKGQPSLKIRYEEYLLQSPSVFDWDNMFGPSPAPKEIPRPPDWVANKLPKTPPAQGMDTALRSLASRLIPKDSMDVVLGEVLRDADTPGKLLAIHCLGAMNEWSKLLDALADEKDINVRYVAYQELLHLLGLDPGNDAVLAKALKQKNYSDSQVQLVLQLLHNFTPEQWAQPVTKATLVEYLMHDKLAVRQITHVLLCANMADGQKIPYDPAGGITQRERGYEDWKRLVSGTKTPGKPKDNRG